MNEKQFTAKNIRFVAICIVGTIIWAIIKYKSELQSIVTKITDFFYIS